MSTGTTKASCRVKATTVRVRDQFVLARYGKHSRERYRAAASPALLATLSGGGNPWVEFTQFVEASQLACDLFADGDITLAREIGRYGAEANMGFWRGIVYRVLSPRTILNMAADLWGHHYEGGRLTATPEGQHGIRLRIEDFPIPHLSHCLAIEGWVQRTIELGRPKRVRVQKVSCRLRGGPACEYVAEWQ